MTSFKNCGSTEGEMYLVCEKRLCCVPVGEHVARSMDYITDIDCARKLLAPFFENEPYEVVYGLALDSRNRFLGFLKLEQGTVNSAVVHLRKLLAFLLCETNATGLILAHSHPSGSSIPSHEDVRLTRRIEERLSDIQVRLLDHIIYLPAEQGRDARWISVINPSPVSA